NYYNTAEMKGRCIRGAEPHASLSGGFGFYYITYVYFPDTFNIERRSAISAQGLISNPEYIPLHPAFHLIREAVIRCQLSRCLFVSCPYFPAHVVLILKRHLIC